jgi:hypothetical protein
MIFLIDVANFEIERAGHTFPGFNRPIKSWLPSKKKAVVAKVGNKTKLLHYGDSNYRHNYSKEAKRSYLARAGGIRNKSGELTSKDKLSRNYWAMRDLWPKNKPVNN